LRPVLRRPPFSDLDLFRLLFSDLERFTLRGFYVHGVLQIQIQFVNFSNVSLSL
jgi:hypothetical protein